MRRSEPSALARLGRKARFASVVPDNALGDGALDALRMAGVGLDGVVRAPGRMGLYFLSQGAGPRASEILYDRAFSAFSTIDADSFDWPALLNGVGLLHLSGITPALGPGPAAAAVAAVTTAARLGVPVSFDGNYRARLWESWDSDPRSILSTIVSHARILFGNHRDIALLLGRSFLGEEETGRRQAADAAFAAYPDLTLIASTARRVESSDHHHLAARIDTRDRAIQTDELAVSGIIDRIGTGDAFAAGVIHGLGAGLDDIDAAARSGLALAILKHSLPGDFSPFRQTDIESFYHSGLDVRR